MAAISVAADFPAAVVASVAAAHRGAGDMSKLARVWKHFSLGRWQLQRRFPAPVLQAIERAVRDCERRHSGEIRFVVEAALPLAAIFAGQTPRQRAIELFSQLRVWDTEHNNGVLIYVLFADRAVEIVADRGVGGEHVAQREWDEVCQRMETAFGAGQFEQGAVAGVHGVADVLARHAPGARSGSNEQPDAPLLL
jgi:uncharacterized membrane protein